MGNSQGKNQYVIPWGRIILIITIRIIIILVVAEQQHMIEYLREENSILQKPRPSFSEYVGDTNHIGHLRHVVDTHYRNARRDR